MTTQPLHITQGPHQLVSEKGVRAPHLFPLKNGDLLLTFHIQGDMHFPQRIAMRSSDQGQSWQHDPPRCYKEMAWSQSRDGKTVMAFERDTFEISQGKYLGQFFRSTDAGKTFEGPFQTTIHVKGVDAHDYPPSPDFYPAKDHPLAAFYHPIPEAYNSLIQKASTRRGPGFWRYGLQLHDKTDKSDNTWIASMQTRFYGDNGQRSILVQSIDDGRSWQFKSTISHEFNRLIDGNCEPALARAADGSLLCIMRRAGNEPLAQTRSIDQGITWSPATLIQNPGHGIDPDLLLLDNGILVCSHGRPGIHLMFSPDGSGQSWTQPHSVADCRTSGMMSIAPIGPDKILAVYDKNIRVEPGRSRDDQCSIWSTTFKITRD